MPSTDGERLSSTDRQDCFATTLWNVVQTAGEAESNARAEALERLCRSYWYPLYAYVRRFGSSPEDAEDLTQGFFARLLQGSLLRDADRSKGRFRSFLLGALKHYLSDERDRAGAAKRGGGRTILSWDANQAESRFALERVESRSPDRLFDKSWAVMALERVVERVRQEYAAAGKSALFDALRQFLWGDEEASTYAELAQQLGMTNAALKMAATRLRRRCREVLRAEVAETVASPDEVEDEVRHLVAVLRG